MAEFLLEILTEEVPARMQADAAKGLLTRAEKGLKDLGLKFDGLSAYHTPRRLVVHVTGLPEKQDDINDERKGPRVDAPEKAIEGFLKSAGVTREECEERDLGKGVFLFIKIFKEGALTRDVLPGFIDELIRGTAWPKSMKWNTNSFTWVRPMKHIVAIFDGQKLDGSFDLGGSSLSFTNQTIGHRFLGPDAFEVTGFDAYKAQLATQKVILDPAQRRQIIVDEANKLAAEKGVSLKEDEGLLREVMNLVSYPKVLIGQIEDGFMHLPDEVLSTSMKVHQKYFSTVDQDGKLAPYFIFVANTDSGTDNIVAGNGRVLRARLNDGKFFFEQDLKTSADERRKELAKIVFHEKLGSVEQRVQRMEKLSEKLADMLGFDGASAKRAAALCKTDLVSHMVYEFPELQGLMGGYYALEAGESEAIAGAIRDHYSPAGPSDTCPSDDLSIVVAMADKLDVLTGFFAIDQKPTGSKDPFALRRSALGIIRLVLENNLRLSLREIFAFAVDLYGYDADKVSGELMAFIFDRLRVYVKGEGLSHDLVDAVFVKHDAGDLTLLMKHITAVSEFVKTENGQNVLAGYKRASNILDIEVKKSGENYDGAVKGEIMTENAEKSLFKVIGDTASMVDAKLGEEDFAGAMAELAKWRGPVDDFFENVMVNDNNEDLRKNRLNLLSLIATTMNQVAIFSKIEG